MISNLKMATIVGQKLVILSILRILGITLEFIPVRI